MKLFTILLLSTLLIILFIPPNLFAQVNQQWVSRYNGTGNATDDARSIAVDGSGNVYVTGYSAGSGTGYDYATVKYNSSGVQQWVTRYNGTGNNDDGATSVAVDGSGNVYVTGGSVGNGTGQDYATIKYNSSGVQQWVMRYNGTGSSNDYAYFLAIDSSGNVYITGESSGNGTAYDYATIKYNSSGVQQWVTTYNGLGNGNDNARALTIDAYGNVYVTGQSLGNGTGYDYATIKYSQPIGIKPISNEVPDRYSLYQNYPNPFNPSTTIEFNIPNKSFTKLIVFDLIGREQVTLVNEELNAGTYKVEWNAINYSSGVYLYRFQSGTYSETKRMVLIK